ncbi:CAAX amino terminal protease self- immunity [Microbacterium hydrocarbonoxydans]|uniref:CAAX amino terminal protease self-immunity n=1 Tax=Microbacterium hydrocarbonoxydans TaxID=273678 RepID=A0A0M2HSR2_9MICO|nr:type II CAAX endopeptidase family protein [Microbacterium hydrocarbonoxydans]KJL47960.1 CAAX amino terminal protease self- immunity [Microbacterium hydrocarbonoxydans]
MTALPSHRAPRRSVGVDVTWFFTIAIALCFALSVPMVFRLVPADLYNLITPILQLTPLLAAIIMWLVRQPVPFRDTFATSWRGAPKWIGVGVGLIAAIAAIQTAIAVASGIWPLNPIDDILAASVWIIPVFVMQSVFATGEEFGWRGWLATRAASWGFWRLALVSGLVWIVWHLPVLAVIGDRPFWDIVIYFAGMLPWAPLLLALRWRSGSVWPAVLTHGAINSIRVFLLQSVPYATDHLLIEMIGWVLTLAAAAWLMRRGGAMVVHGR